MRKTKEPWWDRLNGALIPYLGPPKLGPYNQAPLPDARLKPCPLCGAPMAKHDLQRSADKPTYLRCPA